MRGTYRELVPLIERVYDRHIAGCCWHVVTDDFNVDAACIESCAMMALETSEAEDRDEHVACRDLAAAWRTGRYSRTSMRKAIMVSDRRRRW